MNRLFARWRLYLFRIVGGLNLVVLPMIFGFGIYSKPEILGAWIVGVFALAGWTALGVLIVERIRAVESQPVPLVLGRFERVAVLLVAIAAGLWAYDFAFRPPYLKNDLIPLSGLSWAGPTFVFCVYFFWRTQGAEESSKSAEREREGG